MSGSVSADGANQAGGALRASTAPTASPLTSVAEVRHTLTTGRYDTIAAVVVVSDGIPVGVLDSASLAGLDGSEQIGTQAADPPVILAPEASREAVINDAVRSGASVVPIVDDSGRYVGVIEPRAMLQALLGEHEEDLVRLGGFLKASEAARSSSLEPVVMRFRHRLPWLGVGLAGALLAAVVVGGFERRLAESVALAFFLPGIVYLADAVGTQTETVVVRGLSVGTPMRSMVRRELVAGFAIGVSLALVAGPVIWLAWGEATVALIVSAALFAACSTATVAAMVLPWLLTTWGSDPAFGSGPLATVVQDLLSIVIYFAIAALVMG